MKDAVKYKVLLLSRKPHLGICDPLAPKRTPAAFQPICQLTEALL